MCGSAESPGLRWAIAPGVAMVDRLDLLWNRRLSVNLGRVIFAHSDSMAPEQSAWVGSGLYEFAKRPRLPDVVYTELRISDSTVEQGFDVAGIQYMANGGLSIVGRLVEETRLELHWTLPKVSWGMTHSWRWAGAAEDALSVLLGQEVRLLRCGVWRGQRRYVDVRRRAEPKHLGLLSPLDPLSPLDKASLLRLTEFFARDEPHAQTCRRIFRQMAEASRQRNWHTTELLLATILEAAMRNIYQVPFQLGADSLNVKQYMDRFRRDYLSPQWNDSCDNVREVVKHLRHRNAHPDWLFSQGGALSEPEAAESLDQQIFLSRFYGYMILALAGFDGLVPRFPRPHKEWGAPAVLHSGDPGPTE